ncbi:hypothetical protein AB7W11_19140 [Providencia manganoxydans]|uniref:hypothetical protein n=1 Tax=Providencia manganoxydans TaxID=2923283 RepID=UPI0034E3A887
MNNVNEIKQQFDVLLELVNECHSNLTQEEKKSIREKRQLLADALERIIGRGFYAELI